MATPFPGTAWTITDASGNPINGAKIYTYAAGTLTAKAAYTTSALTTATSNPIITDSSGRAQFFLGPGAYRIRVFDATDVELPAYACDNMVSAEGVAADLAASGGAALVGNVRSFTGAVAATLHGWIEGRDISIFDAMTADDAVKVMAGTYDATLTAKAQAAIDALQAGQVLHIVGTLLLSGSGLTITNKNNITITGGGTLSIANAGANVDAVCLKHVGTCDRVRIENLGFVGAGNSGATYFQYGVYNNSGQTLSNITIEGCTFSNLNAGPCINADTSGTARNCYILNNTITDMVGVNGGQGYGAFMSNVVNGHISGNIIERCQRHSIYFSKGGTTVMADYGNEIHHNVIRDHRSVGFTANTFPAIMCIRGYGYSIKNNKVVDFKDGGILVAQDNTDTKSAGFAVIEGNELTGRKNAIYSIMVGFEAALTSYRVQSVRVANNVISTDIAVGSYQHEVYVPNGKDIQITGNKFYVAAIPNSTFAPIKIGGFSAAGVTDLDNVIVKGNDFSGTLASAFTPTSQYLVQIASDVCAGASRVKIVDNEWDEAVMIGPAVFSATQTNTKVIVQSPGGLRKGLYIAADTTPTVGGGVQFLPVANAGATDITTLDDATGEQEVLLAFADGNTTVKHATGNIRLAGGVDFVSSSRDVLKLTYSSASAQWWESGRSVNT